VSPDELLLRECVRAALHELRLNKWLLNRLGIHDATRVGVPIVPANVRARRIAIGWIDDAEYELGRPLGREVEAQVKRVVADRWGPALHRAHGDEAAAEREVRRLLDDEFNHLYLQRA